MRIRVQNRKSLRHFCPCSLKETDTHSHTRLPDQKITKTESHDGLYIKNS